MTKIYFTNKENLLTELSDFDNGKKSEIEITIDPNIKFQKHLGFGGALTDAACISFNYLNKENKEKYLKAYFSKEGLNYNLLRYPLGSCDFSTHNYHYLNNGDINSLSIDCDKDRIAMYKEIAKYQNDLTVFAAPWSPPSFMKTNGDMNHGGKLKEEYYELYAEMLAKSVSLLKEEGLKIKEINTQNEPLAKQVWDSCIYTAKEEAKFVNDYLLKAINKYNLKDLSIGVWDHNRDCLIKRVDETFSSSLKPSQVQYLCFHWYSNKDFEQLDYIHNKYPNLHPVMTEGCVELLLDKNKDKSIGDFAHAERYIHQMINDFNHWCEGYIDWNLSLDDMGGPNHVGNYCEAPIMIDKNGNMKCMYSYYAIGHFAKFVQPGAYRIETRTNSDIEMVAYQNPDNSIAIVLYNPTEKSLTINNPFATNGSFSLLPHAIYTIYNR